MSTIHDAVPRKKIATYGKAARRRIPEYNFVAVENKSKAQSPESLASSKSLPSVSPPPAAARPKKSAVASPPSKPVTSNTDVFDVPMSDDEKTPAAPLKKSTAMSPRPKVVSSNPDVFDVPMSDNEAPAKKRKIQVPKPINQRVSQPAVKHGHSAVQSSNAQSRIVSPKPRKHALKLATTQTTKPVPRDTTNPSIDNAAQAKRLKHSPPHDSKLKRLPINTKPQAQRSMGSMAHVRTVKRVGSPAKASSTTVPAKLAPEPQEKIDRPRTPKRLSSQPLVGQHGTSPQFTSMDIMDVDPQSNYMSPKSVELWKNILEPEDEQSTTYVPGRARGNVRTISPDSGVQTGGKALCKPAGISKHAQRPLRELPRKRLIDSLVDQAQAVDSDEDSDHDMELETEGYMAREDTAENFTRGEGVMPEQLSSVPSGSQVLPTMGPKIVYGRERTILAEQDFMKDLELDMPLIGHSETGGRRKRRGSIPTLPALASFHEVAEEEDESSGVAVLNVHELRQAGANNRFLDEIEDFVERIGTPAGTQLSMRRSGLLDLASKMQDKTFTRQFRANGAEQRLFVHLGQETDVVAGFVMASLLTVVLADGNMPHIVSQLRRQGITRLLIRLLENTASIVSITKDRKTNMSKISQSLIVEYSDHLLQLPIWEALAPQLITPRTIALKCLEKMVRQTREAGDAGDIFSKELTTKLFAILKTASDENIWDLPKGKEAIDFYLALSALESHSITARTAKDESIWISDFLPVIADALQVALSRPVDQFGEIQLLMLRLALNVTNNNPKGADVFARPTLLGLMGQVIVAKFKKISRFLKEDELFVVMDHLILVLGVMINFAEWSSTARESLQSLDGKSDDPLDRMVQLFVDNQERMAEADSVEESQKNVAFGYLSVLLGYFALLPAMSERIQKRHPRKNLKPLISAIQEFIGHHKTVDDLIAADPDGHSAQSGLTERLESLVARLSAPKGPGKGYEGRR